MQAERDTIVVPEEGLHARPAAVFVQTAKRFASGITVIRGEREANAKSPLSLLTLGAKKGDRILIRAEGEDADAAVDTLVELISRPEP
jgi:phosphocarrier protein HPr